MDDNDFTLDVSIIIVNYNTKNLLSDCLKSIYEQTKNLDFEVIVSDNGSSDGSIEMLKTDFPQVILIENNANLGFGAANNRGQSIAKGKYIFYLNSDTILLNNAVKSFFDYWENSNDKIGALGCNLLNKNNETVHSYDKNLFTIDGYFSKLIHLVYGTYKLSLLHLVLRKKIPDFTDDSRQERFVGEVKQIIGADLFLKNDDGARFDENFFMYKEETELEYRLIQSGKSLFIIDGPQIIHLEGGSQGTKKINLVQRSGSFNVVQTKISELYYFKKYKVPAYKLFFIKLLNLILWCNPMIFASTRRFIPKMLAV